MKTLGKKISRLLGRMGKRAKAMVGPASKPFSPSTPSRPFSPSQYIWETRSTQMSVPRTLGLGARSPFGILGALLAVLIVSNPAWADGQADIVNAGNALYGTLKAIGLVVFIAGICYTGLLMAAHDEHAFKKAGPIMGGGAIMLFAKSLATLLATITNQAWQ